MGSHSQRARASLTGCGKVPPSTLVDWPRSVSGLLVCSENRAALLLGAMDRCMDRAAYMEPPVSRTAPWRGSPQGLLCPLDERLGCVHHSYPTIVFAILERVKRQDWLVKDWSPRRLPPVRDTQRIPRANSGF